MAIIKAELTDLDQCADILFIPEIGKLYFPQKELLRIQLEKGLQADEIYIEKTIPDRIDSSSEIEGVIWYQREGLFHSFPYLHMIAVRDGFRHNGVGARLMDQFEQDSLLSGNNRMRVKAFLLVSGFNVSAQRFYRDRGYEETGEFENLFRKGVTEKLFMKKVTKKR